jgi:cAMP-dependent protein kinase regulator
MFNTLNVQDMKTVIDAMEVKLYNTNDFVIKQGDDGKDLFIVSDGKLNCTKIFPGKKDPTFLKQYKTGEVFGELSLFYNTPRAASIMAIEKSICF